MDVQRNATNSISLSTDPAIAVIRIKINFSYHRLYAFLALAMITLIYFHCS